MATVTPISPDNSYLNAVTSMGVDIYPHDPNPAPTASTPASNPTTGQSSTTPKYTFNAGNPTSYGGVIGASVSKNIRSTSPGSFDMELTPGGPASIGGVDSTISWTSIITPMSLVVLYMARGNSKRIVMVGLVTAINETQNWNGRSVQRTIHITGTDCQYFFSTFSYYTLTFLGAMATAGFALDGQPIGLAGFIFNEFGGVIQASPAVEGALWFIKVMVGEGNAQVPACLEQTYVTYQGKSVLLKKLFAYSFQAFQELGQTVIDGGIFDISNSESDWMAKFYTVFPLPYYEFFVTTATAADYPLETGAISALPKNPVANVATGFGQAGFQINASSPGYDPVFPLAIARISPLPWIELDTTTGTLPDNMSVSSGTYHDDRWQALPLYSYPYGFITSSVEYGLDEIGNFFGVMTSDVRQASDNLGGSPLMTSLETLGGYMDRWSIDSYGYQPKFKAVRWLTTPVNDLSAPPNLLDKVFYRKVLLGKLASYYVPTPNMLKGSVTIPLWPSVIPGTRFEYAPFKNSTKYTFYVEGVSHRFRFGGPSTTTLTLSRGLPSAVYANSNHQMSDLHLDNLARVDGNFVTRSNSVTVPGLFYINTADSKQLATTTAAFSLNGPGAVTSSAFGLFTPSVPASAEGTPNDYTINSPYSGGVPDPLSMNGMFQTAAASCIGLDWKLLWAQAQVESSGGLNPAAMNTADAGWLSPSRVSFGIMQINCNHNAVGGAADDPCMFPGLPTNKITQAIDQQTPTTLTNSHQMNIDLAAAIMCENLSRSRTGIRGALQLYNHDPDYVTAVLAAYATVGGKG